MGSLSRAQFVLALQGLALLRHWYTGDEAEIQARIDDILQLVRRVDEPGLWEREAAPEEEVVDAYSSWVHVYGTESNHIHSMEEPAVRRLLDEIPPGRVLDAACGTGRHTQYLFARGHRVFGVDRTPAMLQIARKKVAAARFLVGDLEELPLASAGLDLAICTLALTHLPSLGRAVAELARVVRPGGRLILSDVHPFTVILGGQAGFHAPDGTRAFVRNYIHLYGHYLAAFAAARLQVLQCIEPTWGEEQAAHFVGREPISLDAMRAAVVGLPGILIWDLMRV